MKCLPRSTHPPTTLFADPCHREHATLPGYVPYDTHPEYITLPVRCFAGHARTFTAAQTPLSLQHFSSLRPPRHTTSLPFTAQPTMDADPARSRVLGHAPRTLHTVALLPDTHGSCPVTPHTSPAPHACLICPLDYLYLPPPYRMPPDASPAAACMITAESAAANATIAAAAAAAAAAYLGHAVFLPPPPTHQPHRTCVVAPDRTPLPLPQPFARAQPCRRHNPSTLHAHDTCRRPRSLQPIPAHIQRTCISSVLSPSHSVTRYHCSSCNPRCNPRQGSGTVYRYRTLRTLPLRTLPLLRLATLAPRAKLDHRPDTVYRYSSMIKAPCTLCRSL